LSATCIGERLRDRHFAAQRGGVVFAGGSTDVLAVQTGYRAARRPPTTEVGWQMSLAKLAALVEGG
jgi:hypothetical protein